MSDVRAAAVIAAPGDDHARLSAMSSAQQSLWLADRAVGDGAAFNLGRVVQFDGPLDATALGEALGDVAARHETLRMSVLDDDDQLLLRIEPPGETEFELADVSVAESDERAQALVARPFERGAARLWRAELHRLAPGTHRLVLVFHHVIADISTIALILTEIAACYQSRLDGEPAELPSARPFSEYVAWERDFARSASGAAQVAYWTHQVNGVPPLDLPTDRPRQPQSRHPGANLRFSLPAATGDALRAAAREGGATLAHGLLTCYAITLHRFAGRDDLVIGMPLSIRHGSRWATSAGLFVNTMPIRVSLRGNPPLRQLLGQVRGTVFAALGAAEAPLAEVATDAGVRRSAGSGRLYDVIFGLTNRRLVMRLPGVSCRVTSLYADQAKFELHLEFIDDGPGTALAGLLEYDTELFDPSTAQRFVDGFAAIVSAAAQCPDQPVGNMALWRGRAAGDLAGPRVAPLADHGSVDRLFAATAAANGASVGLIDAGTGAEYSYAELAARARATAAGLAERGIGRGDFVGVTLPRSTDLVVAILGVLTAGAAYVPLDVSYPAGRLADMVKTAGIRLIIGDAPAELALPTVDLGSLTADPGPGAPCQPGGGEDPAYVMFTSGSTGAPKAVVVPHRAIVRLVKGANFAAMTAGERWLHCASPSFDASTLELWAPLLNGGAVVVLAGQPTVDDLGRAMKRRRVTSAFLTTGLFNLVVDTDVDALRPLRELIIGGEAASTSHMRRALQAVPTVTNAYGPTENTTFTTCYATQDPAQVSAPVPIGRPITGTTVHVVDAYLNEMPPGATGEIVAGGHGLAIGYANAPALTAERFVPNPFGPPGSRLYRTGDYGKLGPDGVVHFVGRVDDQVKVRGFRVELGAIEHALLTHPGVSQAAVAVHADPTGDRRLVGYTVGTAGAAELTEHLRGQLPGYMVPGQWIALDALPLGSTGKVDRAALPAPATAAAAPPQASAAAQDRIIAWYGELLGLSGVSADTDFFLVGGHSLFAARLVSRVKATFGVELSISVVFDHPRIADLAAVVAQSAATTLSSNLTTPSEQ